MGTVPTRERPEWQPGRPPEAMSTLTATSCRGPSGIYIFDEFVSIAPRRRADTVNSFTYLPIQLTPRINHASRVRRGPPTIRAPPGHRQGPHKELRPVAARGTSPPSGRAGLWQALRHGA